MSATAAPACSAARPSKRRGATTTAKNTVSPSQVASARRWTHSSSQLMAALLEVAAPRRLGERLAAVEAALQRVPVRDLLLAVLPAEQADLTIDLGRKVDQAELEALELASAPFDLVNELLELFHQAAQLRTAFEQIAHLDVQHR